MMAWVKGEEDVRLGRVGAQVDLLQGEDVGRVVCLAEGERVVAGHGAPVAEDLLLAAAEEGEVGRDEAAEEQGEEAAGVLHG